MSQLPVTRLGPLHCHQQQSPHELETPGPRVQDDAQLLRWQCCFEYKPDKDTCVEAFVRLVSQILVLQVGEAYCIQDSTRRGLILAHQNDDEHHASTFIKCQDGQDIPSDFSIGRGKVLQLHADDDSRHVWLEAQPNVVPREALAALGHMLQDLIVGLQQSQGKHLQRQWTQPSLLNIPPIARPLVLFPHEPVCSGRLDHEPALLHRQFEQRAAEIPERIALDFLVDLESGKRIQYTYQQMDNAANALAAELAQSCAQSSIQTAAVLMGPSPELYISYLAALKAGVAFCPIPMHAPQARKEVLMADLKPTVLLVATSTNSNPYQFGTSRVTIDVTGHLSSCNTKSGRRSLAAETDVAYILYTSGSSGMPKGVQVSHIAASCTISALSAHCGFFAKAQSLSRPIRWFQGAAPTFDISLFEIFWTLGTGSTLCCAPREFTLQDINKAISHLNADITNITPSFANLLDPSLMRGLMVGGETLNTRLVQDFACHASSPGHDQVRLSNIYNGYGPTETAIYCIAQPHVPVGQRGSVIGKPLATSGIMIVDERAKSLHPVPMGAIGELVVTGPQVSSAGYLNRPDETARVFVDDAQWGRAYRTGDRGRIVWNDAGEPVVEFLGRISDGQVKLQGRRVELGEVDQVLASRVQGIREILSCVWTAPACSGSDRIVALVVLEPRDGVVDFDLVRQRCLETAQRHLPDYMRPFRILQLEALPKSSSGKIDRRAASAYVQKAVGKSLESLPMVEPLSSPEDAKMEQELLCILSEIVQNGWTMTATTALDEAGLDSLGAMRLLRNIRQRWPRCQDTRLNPPMALLLNSGASVRSVFFPLAQEVDKEAETRGQLAKLSSRHMSEALDKLNLTSEADIDMILPTTCTQSQLAVSFAVNPQSYISHSVLRIKPGVSAQALGEAVETVVYGQAIYRCAILAVENSLSPFIQVVLTPEAWHRLNEKTSRVVHRRARKASVSSEAQVWLDLAEKNMSLDSQRLYHIQIVEPDSVSDSAGLLVISIAHCICDGASLEVLMSDIARQVAGLEPLPRHGIYNVVMEWASNVQTKTDELWQASLKGWEAQSLGSLSGNKAMSPSTHGHAMVEHVSALTWQALQDKSIALGASPLTILQASWALLLHCYAETDTEEVVFGSVISGHSVSSHAPTFSVLPCRVALPANQTLRQLLDGLKRASRFTQSHRHTSFGLFKTLPYTTALALQVYPQLDPEDAMPVPWTEIQRRAICYDLAMFVEIFPRGSDSLGHQQESSNVTLKLTYRQDNLSELAATCIVKQLGALTEVMLASHAQDIAQGLPAHMAEKLLSVQGTRNASGEKEQKIQLLHAQFEEQAVSSPNLLALSFYPSLDSPRVDVSYAELEARANSLAEVLREEDVEIIPMCMHRSVELYVAVLAILKAGSAWCPIDETSPLQRRTSLIARTQSKVLLTTTDSLPLVEPCLADKSLDGVRMVLVDQYAHVKTCAKPKARPGVLSLEYMRGQHLAYLLWTSGTTGEPKGVMMQHSAAAQAMRDLQSRVERCDKAGQVRTLQLSAYSFDVFVQDLFYTWGVAGCVVSGTRELILGRFVDFVWKSCPTHAHLTPSFGASISVNDIKGSTLQHVTFIGEKLTEDVAEAWAAPGVTSRTYNTYGPAENAVVSTMRRFYAKGQDQAMAANVGFPLSQCTSYVVREVKTAQGKQDRWQLVPRYGVGELALGGAQMAKGYFADAAKTAKAFIEGGAAIQERIYLTGDLVRLNDHGFEFLGRNDDLVKITGIRIELSEISAACAKVKKQEAAVEHVETLYLERPGSSNKVIVTFVSVKQDCLDTVQLRSKVFQKARDLLPQYMVPGHVVILNTTMPRTVSNKVHRKALQELYRASNLKALTAEHDGKQQQQTWTQQQLSVLQVVANVGQVAVESLSPQDGLAGLGLNSLGLTKLVWKLRKQVKCHVGVVDLLRCQGIGELVDLVLKKLAPPEEASWLARIKHVLTERLHGSMRPADTLYVLPATPMQEALIVETMMEPRAYWAHRVFDMSHLGGLDCHDLKEAWTAVADKFDILRTIFVPLARLTVNNDNGGSIKWARQQGIHCTILQLVRKEPRVRWTWLASHHEANQDDDLSQWAQKLQMELAPTATVQPPWAVTYSERQGKLMLSMHHALYDRVSGELLMDTVAKLYRKQALDQDDAMVQLQRGMGLGLLPTASQRKEAASLWKKHLDKVRETTGPLNAALPDLTQSRQEQPCRILVATRSLPASLVTAPSSTRVPLPTLLQSAFGCILASYLELKAVVIGHNVSLRLLHSDLARVMGPAMATVPLVIRADSGSAEELWDIMACDSSTLLHSMHNLHPIDIRKMINDGSGGKNIPFPGLFVYHPDSDNKRGAQDVFRQVETALTLHVEHPLALNVFEAQGTVELTGNGSCISQTQLDLMLDQIIHQARAMTQSPQSRLDQLQNTMDHRLMSITGQGTTRLDIPKSTDPTERVSVFSRLASHEAGLEPDDVVAMYMGRDIKSLAVTLAIFRAGYVYLALDEQLPKARKQVLISDSKAKLIVTTEQLSKDLDLSLESDAWVLMMPDGENDVDVMLSWPASPPSRGSRETGHGGYLIYTSGSTGRPKGVRVSNANLCHFIAAISTRMTEASPVSARLGGTGKYLNLTSRAFDPHLTQIFLPWSLGYRVVIGKDWTAMLGSLQQVINQLGITHFGSVPSVLTQLGLRPEEIASVKVVTTGGEKASRELLDMWTNETECGDDKATLFNFYGPTEVTIGCVGQAVDRHSSSRSLGKPLAGLEALLLCPKTGMEQVIARRGQAGELCMLGPQVALGYLNRPLEEGKSFQTTSLLGNGVRRMYRTGDMMRMMHDGTLEFLGRADQQAKIRGQRLELDEVVSFMKQSASREGQVEFAAVVLNHERVLGFAARRAVALVRGEVEAEPELLQKPGRAICRLLERLEQKCEAGLPAFMVPTMVWVSRIPYLAASGKVDTKALAKLAQGFAACQQDGEHPKPQQNAARGHDGLEAMEKVVIAAIDEVMGGQGCRSGTQTTAASSLHGLGIDSLSALHLVSLLRERGFAQLTVADAMSSSSTVASMARLAGSVASWAPQQPMKMPVLSRAHLGPAGAGLANVAIEAVVPCLPLQSALVAQSLLWLSANSHQVEGKDGEGAALKVPYVTQFSYRLPRGTQVARWIRAAEQVVASEAMLRSCFIQNGQMLQVVLKWPTRLSPFQGQQDAADMVAQISVRPPIRIQVGQDQDSGEVVMSFKMHHALFDAVAIDVLGRRLEQSYEGRRLVGSRSLELLESVSSYCHDLDGQMETTRQQWQARLAKVCPCRVSGNGNGNGYDETTGAMARWSQCLNCSAQDIKARSQHSVSTVLQLATALCLAHTTQQASVVYGFVTSLRPLLSHVTDGMDDFIGPCLNTVVHTIRLDRGDETLPSLAHRVDEAHAAVCQGAMPLVSVEKVQRWAGCQGKLWDSLLSIKLVTPRRALEGRISPLCASVEGSSDMALAIDVDVHTNGTMVLSLSSAGALGQCQLEKLGRLFEKAVARCADENARVEHFVSLPKEAHCEATTQDAEADAGPPEEPFQEAMACVQTAICRLLDVKASDVAGTTWLYQIGLDSINVFALVSLMNKMSNVQVKADAVLKARSIQGVARLVYEAKRAPVPDRPRETTHDTTVQQLARDMMFVATPLQAGMLSASLAIADKAYTYTHGIQLSADALAADTASLDCFLAAVRDTVQACEILRTHFIFSAHDEAPWIGVVSPTQQSHLVSWETFPSGRVKLVIHHALYDAASLEAMWDILHQHYLGHLQGRHGAVAEHLFRPFAAVVAAAQEDSVAFWSSLLQDYSYTPLHLSNDSLQASCAFHFALGQHELSLVQARCRALGVTSKAAFELAWVKVLCQSLYRQADVVWGQVVSTAGALEHVPVGPTINTVPMRFSLVDKDSSKVLSVAEALLGLQRLSDDARGTTAMASLSRIQTLWRMSSRDQQRVPATLFQSLFVFDAAAAPSTSRRLFTPVEHETRARQGPVYDDYPLIVSFHMQGKALGVRLRAKTRTRDHVETLGKELEKTVKWLWECNLAEAALDVAHMAEAAPALDLSPATPAPDLSPTTPAPDSSPCRQKTAHAILALTKTVLGAKSRGKHIGLRTRLVNAGLDSILAIRLSGLLKEQLGIKASVFQLIKGASIHDVVESMTLATTASSEKPMRPLVTHSDELKPQIAKLLRLQDDAMMCILPVLAGQRAHLEQWLHSGKRFLEAPWVYRVEHQPLDAATVASCWSELRRLHPILRSTFVCTGAKALLVQVTLSEQWAAQGRGFLHVQDGSRPIEAVIHHHVVETNAMASDLMEPPARLSLLEGLDGKALVLRVHHALYDAWTMAMIEDDLDRLLASAGLCHDTAPSLQQVVCQIRDMRQPHAEQSFWREHLSGAHETVLSISNASTLSSAQGSNTRPLTAHDLSPLGRRFKTTYSAAVVSSCMSNARLSAAIIVAYASALGRFTTTSRPTFGLSHASRALSSPDGTRTLDLTAARLPTLTLTPMCVHLCRREKHLVDSVQHHLAQLTKFAQSDQVQQFCPRFNSYLNIVFARDSAQRPSPKMLRRHRLSEPLASHYWTVAKPCHASDSAIQGLGTQHLCPQQFFFTILVSPSRDIKVTVSGDGGGDLAMVEQLVSYFGSELAQIVAHASLE
ncbi:hypothetical protein CDD81_7520 [Ophiocordyceps australis]|uniref:Carrier domain-containing protein n=1 Tax=Ophiocordyceps australis TaxID=1399860 RepID=A0A2C5Y392_9HYPO|nr:hypothetical protein CDD81_7520 [Ophiocordyceps australis]